MSENFGETLRLKYGKALEGQMKRSYIERAAVEPMWKEKQHKPVRYL